MSGETSVDKLLATLNPVLQPDSFFFATLHGTLKDVTALHPGLVEEAEMLFYERHRKAMTLLLPLATVEKEGREAQDLKWEFECRQITIDVHSGLAAVGFMPILTGALAEKGISCNPVSGYYSDHLFVPHHHAEEAVKVLKGLRDQAATVDLSQRVEQ
ncbi:MAG: hypothetical protein Q9162_005206 [Coniocarpon cinnabarinum]